MTIPPGSFDATFAALRSFILSAERFRAAMAGHFDLSVSETVVLSHLAEAGERLTPSQLRQRMLLSSGTLTAIIDRLADDGFVARTANPDDRRSTLVTLKPPGRAALRYASKRMEQALESAVPATSADEVAVHLVRLADALNLQTDLVADNA